MMEKLKGQKAAIWLRVSTGEGHTENQLPDLERWAKQRDWEVVKTYTVQESAFQGAHLKALSEVYRDAQHGDFSILLIWALDRLTRQGPQATLELISRFGKIGCEIYSYQESWTEASGEMKELMLAIAGWIAKQEAIRRSERTKVGMARARLQGKQVGRPKGARDQVHRHRRPARVFSEHQFPQPL